MLRTLIVTMGLAALVLAVPAAAQKNYRDATRENSASVDIASVTVSNDATTGDVGFTVFLARSYDLKDEIAREMGFDIFIDADRNRATGNPRGFDAAISIEGSGGGGGGIMHWRRNQWVSLDGVTTVGVSDDSFYVYVAGADILVRHPKQAFEFVVVTHRTTSNRDAVDRAPNRGAYTYTLAGPPRPAHVVSTAVAVLSAPAAGYLFEVGQFSASLSDGSVAPFEDQRCTASIAGRPLRGTGAGLCSWALPRASRGKRLAVIVSGHYAGQRYTKRLAYTVT
jgi:hypothetical protein